MNYIAAAIAFLFCATLQAADTFFLISKSGEKYGPFELIDGSTVSAGKTTFTIGKIMTDRDRFKERLSKKVLKGLEFKATPLDEVVRILEDKINNSNELDTVATNTTTMAEPRMLMRLDTNCMRNAVGESDTYTGYPAVTFQARYISIKQALDILAKVSATNYRLENNTIVIEPVNAIMQHYTDEVVLRMYSVETTFIERITAAGTIPGPSVPGGSVQGGDELKRIFVNFGIPFPPSASITYNSGIGKVIVANTVENLEKFEKLLPLLNVLPSQVEIEFQFVQFRFSDVAQLAAKGLITADSLQQLRQSGKGDLLTAPKVITRSGSEATVKSTQVIQYPAFSDAPPPISTDSNTPALLQANGKFTGFAEKEVGTILVCTPEVTPSGNLIHLTMQPQYIYRPEWRTFSFDYIDPAGNKQHMTTEQPFFHTLATSTSMTFNDGETLLVGGGMETPDKKGIVYIFVTPRLIGLDGNPIQKIESHDK